MSKSTERLLNTIEQLKNEVKLMELENGTETHDNLLERTHFLQESITKQADWLALAHILCTMLDVPMEHISDRLTKAIEKVKEKI